ncbi:nucleotidyltransferase family protein [Patescibacteria group bacterium]|nr:nucleotidyltransferase family protein [Patescibacteria group bacterium]
MKSFDEIKDIISKEKSKLDKEYGVSHIGIFGSFVRGEQKENSDIDILVEFKKPVGFFKFLSLEEYLEKKLERRVDLVTKKALKPTIGKHILQDVLFI